jgi:hypothetical protein
MHLKFAAILPMALTACATSEPGRVSETPPTVSYSFTGGLLDEAKNKAQNYCTAYNLDAELVSIDERATDSVAHFKCR